MTSENDLILSKLSVRLKDSISSKTIGSGVIYYNQNLKDKVYVLTAAHNLYFDADSFSHPINNVIVDFYNSETDSYNSINQAVDYNIVSPCIDLDIGILVFNLSEVIAITGTLLDVFAIKERLTNNTFTIKGFPNATQGKEIACINPVWSQNMTKVKKFQLTLYENYENWAINGFSGSGVFLIDKAQVYLYGIFARYRAEGKGKVIYCQFLNAVNELLGNYYLTPISFTFYGDYGLTPTFFTRQVETAKSNLGLRYNEKLNFRLPIAKLFNDLAKDNIFRIRLLNAVDRWLTLRSYYFIKENNLIKSIEAAFEKNKKDIYDWLNKINWESDKKIDISVLYSIIDQFNEEIDIKKAELYELQIAKIRDTNSNKKSEYIRPFESELNRLYEIRESNYNLYSELDNISIGLSNVPCLIIQGDAGCGKSHLLGDIANERINNNQPTILLLGQLFKNGQNVWQNILSQLNLSCSKDEFLITLNSIGKQLNSRVLILIDALNEGAGKEIWSNELAGFIKDILTFPFIGIALTVRSTYFQVIVPNIIRENKELTHITHVGFKGNEYEALKLFCNYYGLQQPNFPILSPEFTNPLFLILICEAVQTSGEKKFPQGFQNISKIYDYYVKAIYQKLSVKRDEYKCREHIIKKAICEMALMCYQSAENRGVPIKNAIELFDNVFPKNSNLLNDLILENVFMQNIVHDYTTNSDIEVIFFSYERFGDFYIVEKLLEPYETSEKIKNAFKETNILGILIKDSYWRNQGIIESLAILLPEKYGLEIVEVFDWVFKMEEDTFGNIGDLLNRCLIDSLKWRTLQSINDNKLANWFRCNEFNVDDDYLFNSLIELTTYKGHPFNSDRFSKILRKNTLPERDSFWQNYLRYYSSDDDNGNAYPLKRLTDWSWEIGISTTIDTETSRLAGQTLAWMLASTDIALRDRTTKAMVNLLQEQPDSLIYILNSFKDIDDMYILERLYGIAYGCALRTEKNESLIKIAQFVYDTIFKDGNPPRHILLRDYACNTVEYAIYKQLKIQGDVKLIRPPYTSKMPENIPDSEFINTLRLNYEDPEFKINYEDYFNKIIFSVKDWDFGRYIIDSTLRDFCPVAFTTEKEYKLFLKKVTKRKREMIKLYVSTFELIPNYKNYINKKLESLELEKETDFVNNLENNLIDILNKLKSNLDNEEYSFFENKIIPYLFDKLRMNDFQYNFFDTEPIKNWIVNRVFELGYKSDLHGRYDNLSENYNNRSQNKVERIGKKYQWIAFYEIMSVITDNYKIKNRDYYNKSKYDYYKGAWQCYLRDVDPVFITKNDYENIETSDQIISTSKWWIDINYSYWHISEPVWVESIKDLPDPRYIISRADESNNEWLYLKTSLNLDEPKPIGKERYEVRRKGIWYLIQAQLVYKKDKHKIIKWLNKQNLWGGWLPESHKTTYGLFNRENFWSPASCNNGIEKWQNIGDTRFKIMASTSEAVGEMSNDKSGAHFIYEMPCKMIFEALNLQYSPNDGEFNTINGEVVVVNPNNDGVLIKKDFFMKFLSDNNLDVIWTILGEKNVIGGGFPRNGENYFKIINGTYFIEDNSITGTLSLKERE